MVADTTAVPGHLADLGSGLIRRLAETAGDGVPAGAFGRFATPERSPAFFDPPSAWPAQAHAVDRTAARRRGKAGQDPATGRPDPAGGVRR